MRHSDHTVAFRFEPGNYNSSLRLLLLPLSLDNLASMATSDRYSRSRDDARTRGGGRTRAAVAHQHVRLVVVVVGLEQGLT